MKYTNIFVNETRKHILFFGKDDSILVQFYINDHWGEKIRGYALREYDTIDEEALKWGWGTFDDYVGYFQFFSEEKKQELKDEIQNYIL